MSIAESSPSLHADDGQQKLSQSIAKRVVRRPSQGREENDDENSAAFVMHSMGMLTMVRDAAQRFAKSATSGQVAATASMLEQIDIITATMKEHQVKGGQSSTADPPPSTATARPASASRTWTLPHHALILSGVLRVVDTQLLPIALAAGSGVEAVKLRKLARDLLHLIVVRAVSMLTHRLPLLIDLAVCHGLFAWYRQQSIGSNQSSFSRRQLSSSEVQDEDSIVAERASAAREDLSESVLSIVSEEEERLWNACHRSADDPSTSADLQRPVVMFPQAHPLLDALVSGVLEAERSLLRALELLSQCCSASSTASADDSVAVRTTIKTCVEVNRNLKQILEAVYSRLDKAVSNYVGIDGSISPTIAMNGSGSSPIVATSAAGAHISRLVADAVGVDVSRMLSTFGFEVTRISCGYLVQVASITGSQDTLNAAVFKNKSDAALAMFRIMDSLVQVLSGTNSSHQSSSSGLRATIQAALRRTFLPTTLFSDFLAAIARHCGDENDGQLLCVRLLTDGFQCLCGVAPANVGMEDSSTTTSIHTKQQPIPPPAEDGGVEASSPTGATPSEESSVVFVNPPTLMDLSGAAEELERFMLSPRHRRASLSGLLNVLDSVHKPVLDAALKCLENLVSQESCLEHCAQEIGFLYSNALLRQLESEHSPSDMKLQLVQHYRCLLRRRVFLSSPSSTSHQHSSSEQQQTLDALPATPLILVLYRLFDVNRRLHQVHLVQQYVAALARIVRSAPPSEFVPPQTPQKAPTESLAQAALAALVATAEILADVLPQAAIEDLTALRDIGLLRNEKVEDQRILDMINNLPVKGVCKRFFIDKAVLEQKEVSPGAADDEASATEATTKHVEPSLEYSQVPNPPNDEIAAKAAAISDFLLHTPAINPVSVGEFLSDGKIFPLQVCRCFMSALDFRGRSITSALGEMLSVLQLPKEGQRIERLLEFFTHAYFLANTTNPSSPSAHDTEDSGCSPRFEDRMLSPPASQHFPFADADACFIVVVATVMLNTDLHNPRVSSKMTRDMFRSQLRGCNNGKDFPLGFAEGIFDSIAKQPLSNVKGIGATSVNGGSHNTTVLPPAGAMDMIFFSASERKELMFGMERQRLVMETRELLSRRSCSEVNVLQEFSNPATSWGYQAMITALARDMFQCMWPSLCVVFGVAASPLVTGVLPTNARLATPTPPDTTLLRVSLRGLGASFIIATAFKFHKEADTILSTILKIAESSSHKHVTDSCLKLLLDAAALEHAVYLSPYSWTCLVQTLVDVRKSPGGALTMEAESVFGHLEVLVARASDANFARTNVSSDAVRQAVTAISANAAASPGDGLTLGANLYVLRRMLVYTAVITRPQRNSIAGDSDAALRPRIAVEKRIAMPLFLSAFGRRAWFALMQAHSGSNECLQLLYECYAELVSEVWSTVGPTLAQSHDDSADAIINEEQPDSAARDTPQVASQQPVLRTKEELFIQCFDIVVEGMRGGSSQSGASKVSSVIRTYILQGVKTILSTTIAATASAEGSSALVPLPIALRVWATLMKPIIVAMTDADIVASEACAIAVLALRHLVVCWCGSRSSTASKSGFVLGSVADVGSHLLPSRYRVGLGILLAHVAYAGSMCADLTSAHSCVAQFATLMTTAVNNAHGLMGRSSSFTMTPLTSDAAALPLTGSDTRGPRLHQRALNAVLGNIDEALSVEGGGEALIMTSCVVERLSLILRSDKQSIRQDAIDAIRGLALLLSSEANAVSHLLHHVGHNVLEASLGYSNPNHKTSITEPCLITFPLFDMEVPATLKRCTRTSFSATLPSILHAIAADVLPVIPSKSCAKFSIFWVERCLVPLVLSPRVQSHSLRILALRAAIQVQQWVLERADAAGSPVAVPKDAAQKMLDIMAFLLSCTTLLSRDSAQCGLIRQATGDGARLLQSTEDSCAHVVNTYLDSSKEAFQMLQFCEPSSLCGAHWFLSKDALHPASSSSYGASPSPQALAAVSGALAASRLGGSVNGSSVNVTSALVPTPVLQDTNFLQQLWSLLPMVAAPFPKIFGSLGPKIASYVTSPKEPTSAEEAKATHEDSLWSVPAAQSHGVLVDLLSHAANHALSLHSLFIQALLSGSTSATALVQPPVTTVLSLISASSSSSTTTSSTPSEHTIHPHAAIRGLMTALLQVELLHIETCEGTDSCSLATQRALRQHLVDILSISGKTLETATRVLQGASGGSGSTSSSASNTSGISPTTNSHLLHLGRSCCSGMAQELSIVVANLVSLLQLHLSAWGSPKSSFPQSHATLVACVSAEDLFDAALTLLSPVPLAASLIAPIKKYLMLVRSIGRKDSRGPLSFTSANVPVVEGPRSLLQPEAQPQVEAEASSQVELVEFDVQHNDAQSDDVDVESDGDNPKNLQGGIVEPDPLGRTHSPPSVNGDIDDHESDDNDDVASQPRENNSDAELDA
ncbi:guanine-nucleotide exchange factor, Sec7, putative [Bodo saltans]|uniref:Guanine-nucleotide exchange factor, Sec7, putative n=1 Tax=Bodo saltans TaxID=75058 RepID=A0A0S4IYJ4_BODSA|nr:guanine-nucleotide exchange factor, Sec7, putative [Bodo saltans]|eukprot:CUG56290.1 guanine-nucleotide exchange factor, Sec7, putative [Bodo saltans]